MAVPDTTTVEFSELDVAAAQVAAVVGYLNQAALDIELTATATITSECDPDTEVTQECRDILLAAIKEDDIKAPIVTAFNDLKTMVNAILGFYDIAPMT